MVCKHSVIKVPCCESIPRPGALLVATWCHCLCLCWDPKWALPGTGKVKVGGGVELLTFTLFSYSETNRFTQWCNPTWSHMMFSEMHRRGDFPKNANQIREIHMYILHGLCFSLESPSLSRIEGPGFLWVACSILLWKRKHWLSPGIVM